MWQIKDAITPFSQGLWIPNLAGGGLGWGNPTHKVTWYINHVVTWQIKVVISPLSQGLWISNLGGNWLFCGCYDKGLRKRKLDNPGISLLLSLVVKKSILYEMLKKPSRYKGKLVLIKNKHKNKKIPTRTKSAKINRILTNSEIRLHHCLCESSCFKAGRNSQQRCSVKKLLLKILQNWQENISVSDTGFFSSVLWNVWEHFFYRTISGNCFWWIGLMVKNFKSVSLIFLNSQLYHAPPGVMTIILV